MTADELKQQEYYYSKFLKRPVKYVGVEEYQGEKHHNFFDPATRLFHWFDPESVTVVS